MVFFLLKFLQAPFVFGGFYLPGQSDRVEQLYQIHREAAIYTPY